MNNNQKQKFIPHRILTLEILGPWIAVFCIMAALTVGVSIYKDFGLPWDEGDQYYYGEKVLAFLLTGDRGFETYHNKNYFGPFFETVVSALYHLIGGDSPSIDIASFRHLFVFLTSILSLVAVAMIGESILGRKWCWVPVVLLLLMPRFVGHSFFNSKDIPFASFFALAMWRAIKFLKIVSTPNIPYLAYGREAMMLGIAIGMCTAIRVGAILLFPIMVLSHLFCARWSSIVSRKVARAYLRLVLTWMFVTILLWPYLWFHPVQGFMDALLVSAHFPWERTVLFNGNFVAADELPWSYLLAWLGITTPVFILIAAGLGVFVLLIRLLKNRQNPGLFLILFWVILPLGMFFLLRPILYDGLRHFLFILPAISLLAAVAIAELYAVCKPKLRIVGLIVLFGVSFLVISDMIQLHPYEYVYFNRVSGGLSGAQDKYETDYWALSYREGMMWLNQHAPQGAQIAVCDPLVSAAYFRRSDLKIVWQNADYFMCTTRWNFHRQFPKAPIIFEVKREGVPLTLIKDLRSLPIKG